MEERDGEERESEAPDTPAASPARRTFRGAHVIALGAAVLIALVAAMWRCG
jgi:hypothetical protein